METKRQQLLFVDDDPNVLEMLERMLSQQVDEWEAHFCQGVDEALWVLETHDIDTVVSDVRMPGKDGFDLLQTIRTNPRTKHIPVIILTGDSDRGLKRRALDSGATDLLNKPTDREDLFARVRSALRLKSYEDQLTGQVETLDGLVRERTRQLETAHKEVVLRLAKACEYRDDETGNHVIRVGCYSRLLAEALGMERDALATLSLTSPLHDVGKIGISDSVLLKPGKLTPEERQVIETHTVIGAAILSSDPKAMAAAGLGSAGRLLPDNPESKTTPLYTAARIAEYHHEKWNGAGYPKGLSGQDIPLEARVVAVADVYDALRSERPYKHAFPQEKAVGIVREESGRHFDPDIVSAFLDNLDEIGRVETRFAEDAPAQNSGG